MRPKKTKPKKAAKNAARFRGVAKRVLTAARTAERDGPGAPGNHAFRTVFISDFHLGSKRAKADLLLSFLEHNSMERLYLVGDIVDGWRFAKFGHWPESHTRVLDAIFAKARGGTKVTFTPGNHDHLFRAYLGRNVRGIEIRHDLVHETADGRRLWVVHGDQFDKTAYVPDWMFRAADLFNRGLHTVNDGYNGVRKIFGMPRKCLVHQLKNTSKHGEKFKRKFALTVAGAAARMGVDGVVCGHIHKAEERPIKGVTYLNTGDWVENPTALVEHFDGRLEFLKFGEPAALKAA